MGVRERRRKAANEEQRRRAKAAPPLVKAKAAPARKVKGEVWRLGDRDGLVWLVERGRLTVRRATAALDWRFAYRAAEGVPLKSCLDPQLARGSGQRAFQPPAMETPAEAKRWLFEMRWLVLKGQADIVGVLDQVVGQGLILRDLAGGDGHKAATLEALLKAGLDMVAEHADPTVRRLVARAEEARRARG